MAVGWYFCFRGCGDSDVMFFRGVGGGGVPARIKTAMAGVDHDNCGWPVFLRRQRARQTCYRQPSDDETEMVKAVWHASRPSAFPADAPTISEAILVPPIVPSASPAFRRGPRPCLRWCEKGAVGFSFP